MDLETLRGIAELMEQHGLTRIKLDEKDLKLDIAREPMQSAGNVGWEAGLAGALAASMANLPANTGVVPLAAAACADAPAPAAPSAAPVDAPAAAPAPTLSTADGTPCDSSRVTEVCAPMVGVFYAAPAPGAEPFVRVGSKVKKGETLCILEAMKLMNEVVAERDGEVVEICVNDGELVEYGRVLFRIY